MVVYTLEQRWEVDLQTIYRRCRFWQKKIIYSDEAHFDLGGSVNKPNYRIWGTENPYVCIEKPKRTQNEILFCVNFNTEASIGPFFFANKQGEAVTANGDRYRAIF